MNDLNNLINENSTSELKESQINITNDGHGDINLSFSSILCLKL
jgi:hypothetical protein